MALYVGLMSGTSLDGVDGVLADLDDDSLRPRAALGHVFRPLPEALAAELLALNTPGADELHRAALATNALVAVYAEVTAELLHRCGVAAADVRALGAHGQTVRHRPGCFDGTGYTLQLMQGAVLAERTGVTTVCDFRSGDVAAGGQGAPLVPAFHAACWSRPGTDVALLNLGGIANLTLLGADGRVGGFDTGPGNVLMNLWSRRAFGLPFDGDGTHAATGRVHDGLLEALRADGYFSSPPPKSTGRDRFHEGWLDACLERVSVEDPRDVMATLAELTARTAAAELRRHQPGTARLLVCGGGALNRHLMQRLRDCLPGIEVGTTADDGVPVDQVEALAFAWLAACRLAKQPANVPPVTGARGLRVLGAVYEPV